MNFSKPVNKELSGADGFFCPKCGERLIPADLEAYFACPYCDYHFERSRELDDFIASPAVERWIDRACHGFPGGA